MSGISKHNGSLLTSLDGNDWMLAVDPDNLGIEQQCFNDVASDAKPAKVPWIIQDTFPGCHGVFWYWKDFAASANEYKNGRTLLRLLAVDYKADVWLNGIYLGGHEGGETPFVFDVTDAMKTGSPNRLAVRVLNPTHDRIDDIVLYETPHRCKMIGVNAGAAYNHGGITDSVELQNVPAVYIEDVFCKPDVSSGRIAIKATICNSSCEVVTGSFVFAATPASGGRLLHECKMTAELSPGENTIEAALQIDNPRLWELNDPYLYCVTSSLNVEALEAFDGNVTRCGFRVFRFKNGYFRLNGRRIYIKCSHTCNHYPIGMQFAHDPDFERRDMLNAKAMGFNMVRFIWGGAKRAQLDLCDELGLLAYVESYAANQMAQSGRMEEYFLSSIGQVIQRDRNHPSVVIWGLLNEIYDGPLFEYASKSIKYLKSIDDSRMLMLNSGRFDGHNEIGSICNPDSMAWQCLLGGEAPDAPLGKMTEVPGVCESVGDVHAYPRVPHTSETFDFLRTLGHDTKHILLSEYGVGSAVDLWRTVRHYEQLGKTNLDDAAFYRDKLDKFLNDWDNWHIEQCFERPEDYFMASLAKMAQTRTLGLNAVRANPNLLGHSITGLIDHVFTGEGLTTPFRELKPGTIDAIFDIWYPLRLCLFAEPANIYSGQTVKLEAVLVNEDVLSPGRYLLRLQVFGPNCNCVFDRNITVNIPVSSDGDEPSFAMPVFSEQIQISGPAGKYKFLATFENGAAAGGGKAEFYIRAIPDASSKLTILILGQDKQLEDWLTAQGITVKPFDGSAGSENQVILVAKKAENINTAEDWSVLIKRINNGDTAIFLSPDVFNKNATSADGINLELNGVVRYQADNMAIVNAVLEEKEVFTKIIWGDFTYAISGLADGQYTVELAMCELFHDGPAMRLFDVIVNGQCILEDFDIFKEAGGKGIVITKRFAVDTADGKLEIYCADKKNSAAICRLRILDEHDNIAAEHSALAYKGYGLFPFANMGAFIEIVGWLYQKDEWAKKHPIFENMPAGGMMDYTFYREIIPDIVFNTKEPPSTAIAGAIKASQDYSSGLTLAEYKLGSGSFILNTLLIGENLGKNPAADQLMLNMINYAAITHRDETETIGE